MAALRDRLAGPFLLDRDTASRDRGPCSTLDRELSGARSAAAATFLRLREAFGRRLDAFFTHRFPRVPVQLTLSLNRSL